MHQISPMAARTKVRDLTSAQLRVHGTGSSPVHEIDALVQATQHEVLFDLMIGNRVGLGAHTYVKLPAA